MKKAFQLVLTMVLALAATIPAFPQSDASTATIKGAIMDPNNAVVPGATVIPKSVDRGISRTAKTDQNGIYQIPLLQPGTYEVSVEATGFQTGVAKNLQ